MSLLDDLQNIAGHLSPSDIQTGDRVVGALIKVLEHEGLKVPTVEELLPEDHPARVSPPAPATPAQDTSGFGSRLAGIEAALAELLGHKQTSGQDQAPAGPEASAPSPEPAAAPTPEPPAPSPEPPAPELDRP